MHKRITCNTCGTTVPFATAVARNWNATAEINAATLDYRADAFGRVVGTPKGGLR